MRKLCNRNYGILVSSIILVKSFSSGAGRLLILKDIEG